MALQIRDGESNSACDSDPFIILLRLRDFVSPDFINGDACEDFPLEDQESRDQTESSYSNITLEHCTNKRI